MTGGKDVNKGGSKQNEEGAVISGQQAGPSGKTMSPLEDLIAKLKLVYNEEQNRVDEYQTQVKYDGFNAQYIREAILAATKVLEKKELDILYLAVLVMERGTKTTKILKKISNSGKETLKKIIENYNIKERASDRESLTIQRILTVCPWIPCQFAAKCSNPNHKGTFIGDKFNDYICSPQFVYLIPKVRSNVKTLLMKAFAVYNVKFSKVINPKFNKFPDTDVFNKIKSFMTIQIENSDVDTKTQLSFLKEFGLIELEKEGEVMKAVPTTSLIESAKYFDMAIFTSIDGSEDLLEQEM